MVLADREQRWRGRDASGCVDQEKEADVVREVRAGGEFGRSLHQRDDHPQQSSANKVAKEHLEPTARDRLRVAEVRQGEDHRRHKRQKDAVAPDAARALHDVAAKEQLFGGGLDRGED